MDKVEIKRNTITTQCVCDKRNARHRITISKIEIPLCNNCLENLKDKIKTYD